MSTQRTPGTSACRSDRRRGRVEPHILRVVVGLIVVTVASFVAFTGYGGRPAVIAVQLLILVVLGLHAMALLFWVWPPIAARLDPHRDAKQKRRAEHRAWVDEWHDRQLRPSDKLRASDPQGAQDDRSASE